MGFNFPNSPTEGAVYTAASGQQYTFSSGVWLQTGFAITPLLTAQSYNRVINGAMQHSQENGNTASGPAGALYYAADQFAGFETTAQILWQRVQVTTPNGSKDRFRSTVAVAKTSLAAGDQFVVLTKLEGVRIADFQWGTAQAKQVILRFGWKSPAGTYTVTITTAAASWLGTFTIIAGQANTDTVQTLIIPGATIGTWSTDTAVGFQLSWTIACGTTATSSTLGWQAATSIFAHSSQTNGVATNGNTFELFDVGLYLDPDATGKAPAWVTPDYGAELHACLRYFQTLTQQVVDTAGPAQTTMFRETMRTNPAISGGGAGFTNPVLTPYSGLFSQTGRAFQTLLLNARM
jgi:hypothetical protein